MFKIKVLFILLTILFASQAFAASEAIYNAQTGALHIPKVIIEGDASGASYTVEMIDQGGYLFDLTSATNAPTPTLTHLAISGGTQVYENMTMQLSALAVWSDGTWTDVTSETTWTENSSALSSVNGGVVLASDVPSDRTAQINASYSYDNWDHNANQEVKVLERHAGEIIEMKSLDLDTGIPCQSIVGVAFGMYNDSYLEIVIESFQEATTFSERVSAINGYMASQYPEIPIVAALGDNYDLINPDTLEPVTGTAIYLSNYSEFFIDHENMNFIRDPGVVTLSGLNCYNSLDLIVID